LYWSCAGRTSAICTPVAAFGPRLVATSTYSMICTGSGALVVTYLLTPTSANCTQFVTAA